MAESTNHSDEFMVPWTEMQHGTREHYEYLGPAFYEHARESLVDNLMMLLGLLKGPKLGYQTDRYSHSLQSGTRAYRNDCLLYTSPSPRDRQKSRMPSSA